MLSAAIRARSAFVRRRRPLGPSITSSRETPAPLEPSRWTPILPSLSKIQSLRHAHARRMAGSDQKWQKGVGVPLTTDRMERLTRLRDRLDGYIGCGCLSMATCAPCNPDDVKGVDGAG